MAKMKASLPEEFLARLEFKGDRSVQFGDTELVDGGGRPTRLIPSTMLYLSSDGAYLSSSRKDSSISTLDSSADVYSRDIGDRFMPSPRNSHLTPAAMHFRQGDVREHLIY